MPIEAVDPGNFIYPSLYVQDSTIQRLAKLCEVRPRGMMQIRDELSGLFAGMARQSGARGFFLECWNGEKHIVERVDAKRSLTVPNLLVGVIGVSTWNFAARSAAMRTECTFDTTAGDPRHPLTDVASKSRRSFRAC
jgi:hypothetical protein